MTTALHEQYPAPHPATMLQIMQIQRLRCATEGTIPPSETVIKASYRTRRFGSLQPPKVGQELRPRRGVDTAGPEMLRVRETKGLIVQDDRVIADTLSQIVLESQGKIPRA